MFLTTNGYRRDVLYSTVWPVRKEQGYVTELYGAFDGPNCRTVATSYRSTERGLRFLSALNVGGAWGNLREFEQALYLCS